MKLKRVTGLGLLVLALTACVAEVGDGETVGTADDAVAAVVAPGTIPLFEPEPEPADPTPDIPGNPRWRAYIAAPKGHPARYGAASTRPDIVTSTRTSCSSPRPMGGQIGASPSFSGRRGGTGTSTSSG